MSYLKSCPFCIIDNNIHEDNCYFTLVSRAKQYDQQYPYTGSVEKPTERQMDNAWNNRPYEKDMKEVFLAGVNSYKYIEDNGVTEEDAYIQWLDHVEGRL